MISGIPADSGLKHYDVIVVGAGQAGLGTAYWLTRKTGLRVCVLNAAPEIGLSWASRWDSLELFTPRRFSGLPGLRFPAGPSNYPTRVEMAAYLQRYAARFALPVLRGVRVRSLHRTTSGFRLTTDGGGMTADQVVVATGPYDVPRTPAAAADLGSAVHQLHSSQYCRPADIRRGPVHVVGGGNSAAQLACELAGTHDVTVVSSREPWFLPKQDRRRQPVLVAVRDRVAERRRGVGRLPAGATARRPHHRPRAATTRRCG